MENPKIIGPTYSHISPRGAIGILKPSSNPHQTQTENRYNQPEPSERERNVRAFLQMQQSSLGQTPPSPHSSLSITFHHSNVPQPLMKEDKFIQAQPQPLSEPAIQNKQPITPKSENCGPTSGSKISEMKMLTPQAPYRTCYSPPTVSNVSGIPTIEGIPADGFLYPQNYTLFASPNMRLPVPNQRPMVFPASRCLSSPSHYAFNIANQQGNPVQLNHQSALDSLRSESPKPNDHLPEFSTFDLPSGSQISSSTAKRSTLRNLSHTAKMYNQSANELVEDFNEVEEKHQITTEGKQEENLEPSQNSNSSELELNVQT